MLRVLVGVKRVVDYAARVRVLRDGTGIDTSAVPFSMNPFCEIAVEEAVQMKEQGLTQDVLAVAVGTKASMDTLRTALAMGADRATLVQTDVPVEPLGVAKVFAALAAREERNLVLVGKQSIDGDNNQTGQMLAGLLGWPQATFACRVEMQLDSSTARVTREVDGGLETLDVNMPAVISTDLRLNTPRYAKLPNIMKAKKKTIEILCPEKDLGVDIRPKLQHVKVHAPADSRTCVMVDSVDELLQRLREDKVI